MYYEEGGIFSEAETELKELFVRTSELGLNSMNVNSIDFIEYVVLIIL